MFRKIKLNSKQIKSSYLTLVETLLSWSYERRITAGEYHSESCWNIVRLSSALSCFVTPTSLTNSVSSFAQRVLLYPLCRSLKVAAACINDVSELLREKSSKKILSVLLDVYALMNSNSGEAWYLVNEFFIRNCISWYHLMAEQNVLQAIGNDLDHMTINPKNLEFYEVLQDAAASEIDVADCFESLEIKSAGKIGSENEEAGVMKMCHVEYAVCSDDSDDCN